MFRELGEDGIVDGDARVVTNQPQGAATRVSEFDGDDLLRDARSIPGAGMAATFLRVDRRGGDDKPTSNTAEEIPARYLASRAK